MDLDGILQQLNVRLFVEMDIRQMFKNVMMEIPKVRMAVHKIVHYNKITESLVVW
jgi:hypothetical protein